MEGPKPLPGDLPPECSPRLVVNDRGPWIFALYWYSFEYRLGNEAPRRAMSFFGLSSALRAVLLENPRVAPLVRRFDMRARILMAVCLIPGMICLSAFIVLCGPSGRLAHGLQEHNPTLGASLAGLSLLALALVAVFTRDLYRSFTALFEAYNAPDESDGYDRADTADATQASAGSDQPSSS